MVGNAQQALPSPTFNNNQLRGMQLGTGVGGLASGLFGMFGPKPPNPADVANQYIGQIPGQTSQYNQPYYEAGKSQLPGLQNQYTGLMNDPGGKLNNIGQSFQQSPGFQFALQQALSGSNNAAAAGGMAGSPQNQQQNMQLATNLGNQEYYNWLDRATGLYGQGLQGAQGMANQGQTAGNNIAEMIAQSLAQQGDYAYRGQEAQNEAKGQNFGNIAGGIGNLLSAFLFK